MSHHPAPTKEDPKDAADRGRALELLLPATPGCGPEEGVEALQAEGLLRG